MAILHSFECSIGHITEKIIDSSKTKEKQKCGSNGCTKLASRVFLSKRERSMARCFSPTLLFVNKAGEIIMPGRNNPDHLPKKYRNQLAKEGYEQKEITNFREYERFQREQYDINKEKAQLRTSIEQEKYNAEIRANIEAFRRGEPLTIPNENGIGTHIINLRLDDLSPKMREFAQHSIDRALEYRFESKTDHPYIQAMEEDNTYYRDDTTDWKKRR